MRTADGRDWQAACLGNGAGTGAGTGAMRPADYMGVSSDNNPPADTDHVLPGEITTAGSGFLRKQAAWGHVAGAQTYTLTVVFTASASDALPRTLAKAAVFNAPSGGVMPFIGLITPPLVLAAPGDDATLTEQITM